MRIDCHVLVATIPAQVMTILTVNLSGFLTSALEDRGIEALPC